MKLDHFLPGKLYRLKRKRHSSDLDKDWDGAVFADQVDEHLKNVNPEKVWSLGTHDVFMFVMEGPLKTGIFLIKNMRVRVQDKDLPWFEPATRKNDSHIYDPDA